MSFPLKELTKIAANSTNKSKTNGTLGNQPYPVIFEKLFSKEFFDKIKSQMGQKVKPSKSVLEALKHSNNLNQSYKEQIKILQAKVDRLLEENRELSEGNKMCQTKKTNFGLATSINLPQTFQIVPLEPIKIENEDSSRGSLEITILKEKLKYLEEGKALKETRFNEMVEKQAILKGQINQLKNQNDSLQNKIAALEEFIQKTEESSPAPLQYKTSEDQQFNIYINHHQKKENKEQKEKNKGCFIGQSQKLVFEEDLNILVSNAKMIEISEQYDIEKMANEEIEKKKADAEAEAIAEFREIDGLLEQQIRNTSLASNISGQNSHRNSDRDRGVNLNNTSFVNIITENPAKNMMQSIIQIAVDK